MLASTVEVQLACPAAAATSAVRITSKESWNPASYHATVAGAEWQIAHCLIAAETVVQLTVSAAMGVLGKSVFSVDSSCSTNKDMRSSLQNLQASASKLAGSNHSRLSPVSTVMFMVS
jgi:hypothetical protein